VRILDLESQKGQDRFASRVAEQPGETNARETREEGVTSLLHETVQGTDKQSLHCDLRLDQESVLLNEQYKPESDNHEISINLMKQELQPHQEAQQARDGEISEATEVVETLMR